MKIQKISKINGDNVTISWKDKKINILDCWKIKNIRNLSTKSYILIRVMGGFHLGREIGTIGIGRGIKIEIRKSRNILI